MRPKYVEDLLMDIMVNSDHKFKGKTYKEDYTALAVGVFSSISERLFRRPRHIYIHFIYQQTSTLPPPLILLLPISPIWVLNPEPTVPSQLSAAVSLAAASPVSSSLLATMSTSGISRRRLSTTPQITSSAIKPSSH